MNQTADQTAQAIVVNGKQYTLRPVRFTYRQMEEFVVSRRTDPIDAAVKATAKAPASQHTAIWDAAMRAVISQRKTATVQEMTDFESSILGFAWKLWQCVRVDHPEVDSIERALELLEEIGPERAAEVDAALHPEHSKA